MIDTVITFDGVLWDKQELVERMIDNEFYYGYMGKNSLSSSSVKELLKSPRAYSNSVKYPQEDCDAFMFGRLIHESILEPEKDFSYNIIDAKDKRSKQWKDAVKDNIPNTILKRDYDRCMSLVDAYSCNNYTKDLLLDYRTEVPNVVFIDDVLFRVKADALSVDSNSIIDLKTTSDISKFNKWNAMSYGYDCQAYIYCLAFEVNWEDYRFVVLDKTSKQFGIFDISEEFLESGKRKVHQAIDTYKKYFVNREENINNYITKGIL